MEKSSFREKDVPEESRLLEDFDGKTKARPVKSNLLPPPRRLLFLSVPDFIQQRLYPELVKPGRLHPSAYLDGMRGLGALSVFSYHLAYLSHDVLTVYGGSSKSDEYREFLNLPSVRFVYAGPAMVSIFYVVSDYALSYKSAKLVENKSWKELLHTLSSAAFRRAIRLYLPCFVSTLLPMRLGAYDATHGITYERRLNHMNWIFVNPWSLGTKDTDIDIDKHLRTIPLEFRSLLVLYLIQLGLARLKPTATLLGRLGRFATFLVYI
ncbi:hypothetical protein D6C84_07418 [Aureobasidium pullulans]|uniref:Acyltransferase 3 domain-containing protein n=1 Tax=Aureobasidium pullulans TaxID=5580 RepID=A0A4S9XQV1_AURPU|nr:hypothetical protein D6C84_07418 [Aureobasidium pullulans]